MNRYKFVGLGVLLCLLVLGLSDTALATTPAVADNQVVASYTLTGGTQVSIPQGDGTFCGATPCPTNVPLGWSDPTNPLAFANVPTSTTQTLPVKLSCVSCSIGVTVQVNGSPNWLHVTTGSDSGSSLLTNVQVSGNVTTLNVKVNTTPLQFGGTYDGSITVNGTNAPPGTLPITISVHVTVGGFGTGLSAAPSSLSFTAVQGSTSGTCTTTSGCQVFISSASNENYHVSDSDSWVVISPNTGTTNFSGFTVFVNPANASLAAQSQPYASTITVTSDSTSDSTTIPISLTVSTNSTISVSPNPVPTLLYQIGQGVPSQLLTIFATSGFVTYSIGTSSSAPWLVFPQSGSASTSGTTTTLSINPSFASTPNTYTTNLVITPVSPSGQPLIVPVTLVASNSAPINLTSTALTFTAQFNGPAPSSQQVLATTTSGSVNFTATSNTSWLTVTQTSSSTPSTLTISVNQTSLQSTATPYTGTITIRPNDNSYTETITVSLTVTNTSQLVAGPPLLLFSYDTTKSAPVGQPVYITSQGQSIPFNVTTTNTGGSCPSTWLNVGPTSATTPIALSVNVINSGLPTSGICTGNIVLSYNSGTSTLTIPVTLNIAANALLNVGMQLGFGQEIVQQNASSITRFISLSSTETPTTEVNFSTSNFSPPTNWISLSGGGSTPQTLFVTINPSGLPANTSGYTGSISIFSTGLPNGGLTIPVTLIVNSTVAVTYSPSSLSFTQTQGNTTAQSQPITLTSSGGTATFTASFAPDQASAGQWLTPPSNGTAAGQVSASLNTSVASTLGVGTYTGKINFSFPNTTTLSASVPVTLIITPATTLNPPSPATLNAFNFTVGGTAPASQTLSITSTGGTAQISVGTVSSGWLSVTPTSGSTPQTLTVTANPAGITTTQTLSGTITITSTGVTGSPISVPVTFNVTVPPAPSGLAVSGNASNTPGSIAPGELITIKGTNLGPATPANFTVNAQGKVDPTLSGVQVLFDGIPGTPYFVSSTQVNVTVPYEIAGRLSTNITVTYQGQTSAAIQQSVLTSVPAIFTLNGSGTGQAYLRNQNTTLNGPPGGVNTSNGVIQTTPATTGQVVSLIATGGGVTSPASTTGSVNPTTGTIPVVSGPSGPWTLGSNIVTATIGGVNAPVQFAGAYPGLITGLLQINLTVPAGVSGNALPIVLTINNQQSPSGASAATMAVQ